MPTQFRILVCFQPHPEFPDQVSVEIHQSTNRPKPSLSFLHSFPTWLPIVGEAWFPLLRESSDVPGLPARWMPPQALVRHLLRGRGAPPQNWGSPRSELGSLPPLSAQPLSCLARGTREPDGNQGAVPSSSGERPRRSSHLNRQPEVSDAWEGRGHGGREPGGQTSGGCAPRRCSRATRAGQLAAVSQSSSDKRAAIRACSGPPTLQLRVPRPGH